MNETAQPVEPTKPEPRFKIQNLADVDPMTEFIGLAKQMEIGQFVAFEIPADQADAARMIKAIQKEHGKTCYETSTKDKVMRVIRCAPREPKPRTPKTPAKKAADKPKGQKNA